MRWVLDFYHERNRDMARYRIEAPSPATALRSAWTALRAEHPAGRPAGRKLSLVERADRAAGRDASGWTLYRIGPDTTVADQPRVASADRVEPPG